MLEHLTHNQKIQRSNLATSAERENDGKIKYIYLIGCAPAAQWCHLQKGLIKNQKIIGLAKVSTNAWRKEQAIEEEELLESLRL